MNKQNQSILFYTFLVIGVFIRIYIIAQPSEIILDRWGSDDMFYYSQIAGHFLDKGFLTFDGINPGTGVQPLFFLVLVPFGKLLLNDFENSIRILLIVITFFNVITAFFMRSVLSMFSNNSLFGTISASLFIVHPKILSVCFQGTEGGLSMMVFVLLIFVWYRFFIEKKKIIVSSLFFAVCILVRLDFSLLIFGLSLISLIRKEVSIRQLFQASILPVVFLGGWLVFLYTQSFSFFPDSGAAKKLHSAFIFEEQLGNQTIKKSFVIVENLIKICTLPFRAEKQISITTFLLLVIGFYSMFKNKQMSRNKLFTGIFLPFLAASIFYTIVLIALLVYFREWYGVSLFILFIISITFLVIEGMKQLKMAKYTFLILFLLTICWWIEANHYPRNYLHREQYQVLDWTLENIPPGTRIGAFNSGFYGSYLGDKYTVINLDGLVNHAALESLKNKTLYQYVSEEKIEVIIDFTGSIQFYSNLGGMNLMDNLKTLKEYNLDQSESNLLGIYSVRRR
ncbi:hypothetical protein [uncultured Aquimarina sp.]|uniref:hypothetical protein n=1 Tax=uncultured Aquimarina sp. TaxID=575652 RepID=UPI002637D0D1|nr:hypothetical protein [uncultured Aquimarina sp.]